MSSSPLVDDLFPELRALIRASILEDWPFFALNSLACLARTCRRMADEGRAQLAIPESWRDQYRGSIECDRTELSFMYGILWSLRVNAWHGAGRIQFSPGGATLFWTPSDISGTYARLLFTPSVHQHCYGTVGIRLAMAVPLPRIHDIHDYTHWIGALGSWTSWPVTTPPRYEDLVRDAPWI